MPATEVSPALRRRISDDARELLRSALAPSAVDVSGVDLAQRLQDFRGRLRLELLASDDGAELAALELRLAVSAPAFVARYLLERLDAEVSVVNRAGVSSSWITLADGRHVQLQDFLDDPVRALDAAKSSIRALLSMLDLLDLQDLLAASASAVPVRGGRELFAVGAKGSYVLSFDRVSGCPTSIMLAPLQQQDGGMAVALRLVVQDYAQFSGAIDVPCGVKSDVQLTVDAAMTSFARWSPAGRRQLALVFDALDADGDGWVSARDVERQLSEGGGQSAPRAAQVAAELARLLGGGADPAEEFGFREFAGLWIAMLADGWRASDPRNEPGVLAAIRSLFFGEE